MSIRVLLSVEFCFTLKTYLKGAPFYNASACGKWVPADDWRAGRKQSEQDGNVLSPGTKHAQESLKISLHSPVDKHILRRSFLFWAAPQALSHAANQFGRSKNLKICLS